MQLLANNVPGAGSRTGVLGPLIHTGGTGAILGPDFGLAWLLELFGDQSSGWKIFLFSICLSNKYNTILRKKTLTVTLQCLGSSPSPTPDPS